MKTLRLDPLKRCACALALAGAPVLPFATSAQAAQASSAAQDAGISVRSLSIGRWSGPAKVTRHLTPLKVRIENRGDRPIALEYIRFRLVGSDGASFRALPLFRLEGTGSAITVRDAFGVRDRKFEASGFTIAPAYASVYPGAEFADTAVVKDTGQYALYDYYDGKPLPTTGMRRRALPEGILIPGGYVEGFLYFEEVKRSAKPVMLHFDLVDPRTGEALGKIEVPADD